MNERPLNAVESADGQAGMTSATVEVARDEVKQIEQLLQQSYDQHPNRLVRAALNRIKKLTV